MSNSNLCMKIEKQYNLKTKQFESSKEHKDNSVTTPRWTSVCSLRSQCSKKSRAVIENNPAAERESSGQLLIVFVPSSEGVVCWTQVQWEVVCRPRRGRGVALKCCFLTCWGFFQIRRTILVSIYLSICLYQRASCCQLCKYMGSTSPLTGVTVSVLAVDAPLCLGWVGVVVFQLQLSCSCSRCSGKQQSVAPAQPFRWRRYWPAEVNRPDGHFHSGLLSLQRLHCPSGPLTIHGQHSGLVMLASLHVCVLPSCSILSEMFIILHKFQDVAQ